LKAIVSTKYFLEKEKVEKRVIWGLGKGKNLLQYRLPDATSQWTGPEGTPITPQFNIVAHQKPGTALGTNIWQLLLQSFIIYTQH